MSIIKALAMDVDGVLTDGGFWWGPDGQEWKRFCFLDVMGLSEARKAGLILAFISGEPSLLVDRLANKMGIVDIYKGCKDKGAAFQDFAQRHNLSLSEIAFIGDDINDLSALRLAGLSAAPATAHSSVRAAVNLVLSSSGGNGAVRELIDYLLANCVENNSD